MIEVLTTLDARNAGRTANFPAPTTGGELANKDYVDQNAGTFDHAALSNRAAPGQHPAAAVSHTPTADIPATDVQAALDQVMDACKAYIHVQALASASWAVAHNLGRKPSAVAVIDSGGTVVQGETKHTDLNNLVILFAAPFSGTANIR